MADPRDGRVPTPVLVIVLSAVGAVGLLLTVASVGMFGDGAFYLLSVIRDGHPTWLPGREVLHTIRDTPVLIALRLGQTNTHVLAILQSVGYVLLPIAAWMGALLVTARDRTRFIPVAVTCALCVSLMGSFSVTELFLGLALVAFLASCLSRRDPWTWPIGVGACTSSVILVASHESLAVCAVILGVHGAMRARLRLGAVDKVASAFVVVAAVGTVTWAVVTWLTRPNGQYRDFLWALTNLFPGTAVLLILSGVVLAVWALMSAPPDRRRWSLGLLAVASVLGGTTWLLGIRYHAPGLGYHARVWSFLLVVLLQITLFAIWWRRQRSSPRGVSGNGQGEALGPWVTAAFVVLLLVIPVGNAVRWSLGLAEIRSVVSSGEGVIVPAQGLSPEAVQILWGWSNPSLSVLLRSDASDAVLSDRVSELAQVGPFRPFDLAVAQQQLPPAYTWR